MTEITKDSDRSKTARLFAYYVNRSRLTQVEIAKRCGYERQNVISMFKQGNIKIPIDKVLALARAVDLDPKLLLRTAMEEYSPNAWSVIQEILGESIDTTKEERQLLEELRACAGISGVKIVTERQREALAELKDALAATSLPPPG